MNLINGSSVIGFLEAESYGGNPQNSLIPNFLKRRIFHTIESLVLYEDLYLIEPLLYRSEKINKYSNLLDKHFKFIYLTPEKNEEIVSEANKQYHNRMKMPDNIDLLRTLLINEDLDEISHYKKWRSNDWENIENNLPDFYKQMSTLFKRKFGLDYRYFEAACYTLHRTYYYLSFQAKYSCDLILESSDGRFIKESQAEYPKEIIEKFENDVRLKFMERQQDWLGIQVEIKYPMIVSYVLNKSNSWEDVLKNTFELRNSKYAKLFREGMQELTEAIKQKDNNKKDKIFSALENAKSIWSKSLGSDLQAPRKITVTIPFIGIGTEFELKRSTLNKKPEEKMLVFIHELLRFS